MSSYATKKKELAESTLKQTETQQTEAAQRVQQAAAAQAAAKQALESYNTTRPSGYTDNYSNQIDSLLQNMRNRNFTQDYSAANDSNYQNYAQNYTAAAKAAAQNAKATAAALSGGYGSSYADSVVAQAYQDNMASMNNILPTLRAMALEGYQADTNSLESLISGLQSQSEQAYNEYGGNMANWANWRDYLANNYTQAANESQTAWQNNSDLTDWANQLKQNSLSADVEQEQEKAATDEKIRNVISWLAQTALGAYDTYKGYTQQQWENQQTESAQAAQYMALGYQAAEAGQTDLANQYGKLAGLGEGYFTDYTPTTSATSYSDVADALSSAASLKAYGADAASAAILQAAGLDSSLLDGYNPLALSTKTSGSSSSSGSNNLMKIYSEMSSLAEDGQYGLAQQLGQMYGLDTSGLVNTYANKNGSSSGLTMSDYISLATKYDDMDDSNPAKSAIGQMLTNYGTSGSTSGYATGGSYTPTTQDISYARQIQHYGGSDNQIMQGLKSAGYTNEQILAIMNAM